MSDSSKPTSSQAPRQPVVANRPAQPANPFLPFRREEVEQSIPARFEQQVRIYPERMAIRTRTHGLTYQALNITANRLARAIRSRCGDGPEPVALMFEHDAPLLVAILAILKAGKIYVPLDPRYPSARLTYMLGHSQAGLVVTNNRNWSQARALTDGSLPLLNMDECGNDLLADNLELPISAEAVAYILYTSGSTGEPKGVPQLHRNVLHEIMNYTNAAHLSSDDRMLLVSSCSFADSVRTIFGALLNGACLFPLNIMEEGLTGLADWMIEQQVTVYRSVPTVFRHFGSLLGAEARFPDVRLIYMAGEPVFRRDFEIFRKHFSPHCLFVNGLGTSESLTFRWYFLNSKTLLTGNRVPVGYALDDMEVLLLDADGKKMRSDGIGEIAVKSRYLCPGYWRNPELTQAKFHPAQQGSDERIFLSGDLGRLLPDGCLQHMGRRDFQVKIRGHRVEVAEIETLLTSLDGIREAVVAPQKTQAGDCFLVAYLVPAGEGAPSAGTIRRLLSQTLPDYLIPSTFVTLEGLPLLPNGKVDRRAMPVPERTRPELEQPYVAPRTPLEEHLVRIWTEILDIRPIGIHDNFFELGGQSLLATRVVSRLHSDLQAELPLRAFFEAPTVAQLAAAIEQMTEPWVSHSAIVPLPRETYRRNTSSQENIV